MDNPEDINQQILEEKCQEYIEQEYLANTAKYKVGEIVGFIEKNKSYLGVVKQIFLAKKGISNTNRQYDVICYDIITPIGVIYKEEWELFYAADYICRQYLKLPVQ